MMVTAIDPGKEHTGVVTACFDREADMLEITEARYIRTRWDRKIPLKDSMPSLVKTQGQVLVAATKYSEVVIFEVPLGAQSASAAKALGHCTGMMAAVQASSIVTGVTAASAKEALCGDKKATKKQMIQMAEDFGLRLPSTRGKVVQYKAEHIADALGVLLAWSGETTVRVSKRYRLGQYDNRRGGLLWSRV